MKRAWMGLAVIISAMGLLLTGALTPTEGAATRTVTEVQVINFPAVQSVAGTVNVSNLPVDVDGNLKVAGSLTSSPSVVHFVGFTRANMDWNVRVLDATRACSTDFPGSRVCEYMELMQSIPPPPSFPNPDAASIVFRLVEPSSGMTYLDLRCVRGNGELAFSSCASINIYSLPVACCGY